jgi:hypothetical protein
MIKDNGMAPTTSQYEQVLPRSMHDHVPKDICLSRRSESFSISNVRVGSVDADWAFACLGGVLEEGEVGVVGGSLSSHASPSADETRADVYGVCVSRLHVDRWESREWAWCGLVVVGGRRVWARAGVVACPEE